MQLAGSGPVAAVVFDIDGTLLDSAGGIVAGFRQALISVGVEVPTEAALRADLGPPIGPMLSTLGVPTDLLGQSVEAYRSYYRAHGMHQAEPYAGVEKLLASLPTSVRLATATAKRTDTAQAILEVHGLARYFEVINGTDEIRSTKAETIAYTLSQLDDPDPTHVIMVGDRGSDILGGRACGLITVGVTWGYGSVNELRAAGAHLIVDSTADLHRVLSRS